MIVDKIRRNIPRWLGHGIRREKAEASKTDKYVEGTIGRGRPKKRLLDVIL